MAHAVADDQSRKVVILDRDGTIVVDRNYLSDPSGLEFEPSAAQGLRSMYERGCRLVVVTNQSGIGRGLFSHQRLSEIHDRMQRMIESIGARLEGIYYCPHTPDDRCDCRKPKIGLFRQAASDLGFNASSAVVIGDKISDIEFGRVAGAQTILVGTASRDVACTVKPDFFAADLVQAAAVIETL